MEVLSRTAPARAAALSPRLTGRPGRAVKRPRPTTAGRCPSEGMRLPGLGRVTRRLRDATGGSGRRSVQAEISLYRVRTSQVPKVLPPLVGLCVEGNRLLW